MTLEGTAALDEAIDVARERRRRARRRRRSRWRSRRSRPSWPSAQGSAGSGRRRLGRGLTPVRGTAPRADRRSAGTGSIFCFLRTISRASRSCPTRRLAPTAAADGGSPPPACLSKATITSPCCEAGRARRGSPADRSPPPRRWCRRGRGSGPARRDSGCSDTPSQPRTTLPLSHQLVDDALDHVDGDGEADALARRPRWRC